MTQDVATGDVQIPEFAMRAILSSVDVLEAHVAHDGPGMPAGYEVEFDGAIADAEGGLSYKFAWGFRIYDESAATVATVKAVIAVSYLISDSPRAEDPQAQVFGNMAAVHDGYPYVRQLVYDLTARIGIPPLNLEPRLVTVEAQDPDTADQPPRPPSVSIQLHDTGDDGGTP